MEKIHSKMSKFYGNLFEFIYLLFGGMDNNSFSRYLSKLIKKCPLAKMVTIWNYRSTQWREANCLINKFKNFHFKLQIIVFTIISLNVLA